MVASLIAGLVSLDGESNWLEGAMLLALYVIIALGYLAIFFSPDRRETKMPIINAKITATIPIRIIIYVVSIAPP